MLGGRSYLAVGSVFRLATVHLFVDLVQTGSRQSRSETAQDGVCFSSDRDTASR